MLHLLRNLFGKVTVYVDVHKIEENLKFLAVLKKLDVKKLQKYGIPHVISGEERLYGIDGEIFRIKVIRIKKFGGIFGAIADVWVMKRNDYNRLVEKLQKYGFDLGKVKKGREVILTEWLGGNRRIFC